MFEKYHTPGYDLYQHFPNVDQWVFDPRNSQAIHGNLKEIVKYMIQRLDFYMEDIEDAINMLINNPNHDSVHFGTAKSAIFSFNREEKYGKRAG